MSFCHLLIDLCSGLQLTFQEQQVNDDGWYAEPALDFYQKDVIHMIDDDSIISHYAPLAEAGASGASRWDKNHNFESSLEKKSTAGSPFSQNYYIFGYNWYCMHGMYTYVYIYIIHCLMKHVFSLWYASIPCGSVWSTLGKWWNSHRWRFVCPNIWYL